MAWQPMPAVLFCAICLLTLYAGPIAAQQPLPGTGMLQPPPQGQSGPCYLGGDTGASGMQGSYAGFPGAGGDDLQTGDQYPFDPAVQGEGSSSQFSADQSWNQSSMSAAEIVQILQQAPDLLSSIKNLAGQQYGVDPATLSDGGVYNCIRQDPGLRDQISAELVRQGYSVDAQQQIEQPGMGNGGAQRQPYAANPQGQVGQPPMRSGGAMGQYSMNPEWQRRQLGQPGMQRGTAGEGIYAPYSLSPGVRGSQSMQQRRQEPPAELRRLTPMPYPNLPSMRDLYAQEIVAGGRLRRFGCDAFEFGSGNMNLLPMDLPVGPDYVLGPGDNLIVNMWGGQSARLTRTIDRQGQVALPEAGTVAVSGLTIAQAQSVIQNALGTQFQNERVELSLGRVRTVRVYVVGDVQRPGAYDVSSLSTAVNALYAAGGPTSRGSLRTLKQYRGKELVQQIDLYDFLLHGVRTDLKRLMPGDTVLVPPVGPQVAVAGMVRRPAIYELQGKEDLKEVLAMAGGVLASADLKEIRVERVMAHASHTMLRVQVADGASDVNKLPALAIQDGDSVQVSPILPYNEKVVYLEGHVFKPGRYAWREGMTVSDLIHSYQDVMPEAAEHAEVVRLVPPDLHPETVAFNLADELVGNDPVALQPFDTVRVYGRYQIDPPKVSIFGPVLRPGSYPMSAGMTAADLVRMAGGFRRSAYQQKADLSSYTVQNGQKVLLRHSEIDLAKALNGDKAADAALAPGDVVGIRQLTGWNDIGASITINGEVRYAGTYGIEDGERLSSVLKRAGGFRADAYPQGAVLERVQVRQLEENDRQEMIRRVETTMPTASQGVNGTSQDQLNLLQAMQQQRQEVLAALRSHPSRGRLVIKISSDISKWEGTPADIEVRAGDTLTIPKLPGFVLISGQVYDPTGISYRPGRDAGWYLRQAGGATRSGDKKSIFVLRADGSVVGEKRGTIFQGGVLSVKMHPGDSVIVPEKIVGGSQLWRNIMGSAQIMSSVALTGAMMGVF